MTLRLNIHATRAQAERAVAGEIAALLRARPSACLGLPTGNTPTGVYRELVRLFRAGELDLSAARSFNLDEYAGLAAADPRSFRSWMQAQLFDHVNLPAGQVHFPQAAPDYEQLLERAGGLDLVLLGIGRNGHIAFNEPGAARDTRTRLVELHPWTRADAAASFGTLAAVPTQAWTMGVATILAARRLRVLAFGPHKRELVTRTLDTRPCAAWPASWLHEHPDAELVVDATAAP